jgi:hypothetical protein
VYFEEVRRHAGVDAAHAYGGFMAHLTAWCEHHQIPYQGVPVGTIKKHATGKGNANKDQMIGAVRCVATRRLTTTKPTPLHSCTGPSRHRRCDMKVPTPAYRCALARLQPDPRPDPEQIKREGWRDQQILVISPDDARLDWVERELLRRIGDRLYGPKERQHG